MDHVPLPQRPPKRKRPRPAGEAGAGASSIDGASAGAAAGTVGSNLGVAGDAVDDLRETHRPDVVPESVPGVPVFDGTSTSPRYEYKDHTADIQIHSWGQNVEECFAWAALGMFNYMTPLENLKSSAAEAKQAQQGDALNPETLGNPNQRVPGNRNMRKDETAVGDEANEKGEEKENTNLTESLSVGYTFQVEGHDMHSLLFAFLDELLFRFHTSMVVCRRVQVLEIDRENWRVKGTALGEKFVDGVHEQGTEIKAITYSAMQIVEKEAEIEGDHRAELFVIVDI